MKISDMSYVVVEGPIGVGKTTLANKLALEWDAELLLEKVENNPFLEKFYDNPEQLALVETLAIGCHASDRGNPEKDEHLLVIGAGPIGLATIEFNRLSDAKITVMDMSEERLNFCREHYGIDSLIQFKGDGSEKEKMLDAVICLGSCHNLGRLPAVLLDIVQSGH